MRKVIYATSLSLDGYIDATRGDPDWMFPDEELHRHFNELESSVDTHLYGRRMYELMAEFWPTADVQSAAPDYIVDYARIWRAMPKVVFSKTLARVDWNAELVPGDALEAVARLKRQPGKSMSVGGSALATSLAQGGLIDEFRFYVMPTIVGSGTPIFHTLSKHIDLTPYEVRQFTSGAVLLRYRNILFSV